MGSGFWFVASKGRTLVLIVESWVRWEVDGENVESWVRWEAGGENVESWVRWEAGGENVN